MSRTLCAAHRKLLSSADAWKPPAGLARRFDRRGSDLRLDGVRLLGVRLDRPDQVGRRAAGRHRRRVLPLQLPRPKDGRTRRLRRRRRQGRRREAGREGRVRRDTMGLHVRRARSRPVRRRGQPGHHQPRTQGQVRPFAAVLGRRGRHRHPGERQLDQVTGRHQGQDRRRERHEQLVGGGAQGGRQRRVGRGLRPGHHPAEPRPRGRGDQRQHRGVRLSRRDRRQVSQDRGHRQREERARLRRTQEQRIPARARQGPRRAPRRRHAGRHLAEVPEGRRDGRACADPDQDGGSAARRHRGHVLAVQLSRPSDGRTRRLRRRRRQGRRREARRPGRVRGNPMGFDVRRA